MNTWRLGALCLAMGAALGCGGGGDDDILPAPIADYEPCAVDSQCVLPADCYEVTAEYVDVVVTDRMCTVACGSDLDCPSGGFCEDAASGPPLCFRPCTGDADCPPGFACIDDIGGRTYDPICLPF